MLLFAEDLILASALDKTCTVTGSLLRASLGPDTLSSVIPYGDVILRQYWMQRCHILRLADGILVLAVILSPWRQPKC